MPWIDTSTLVQGSPVPYQRQVYNGLDCCVTMEVLEAQLSLGPTPQIYDFERALQAPFLEMMLRGFKINLYEREKNLHRLTAQRDELRCMLDEFAIVMWGRGLLEESHAQLKRFFPEALGVPPIWSTVKGQRKLAFDRDTLERYSVYLYAQPFVSTILAIRDLNSKIEKLNTAVRNGRWYTSYNVAATDTGRISSSKSPEGDGSNAQNIKRDDDLSENEISLRQMFEADEGYVLVSIDREQSESREVGFKCAQLFDDWSYLDAAESSDLHTTVSRLTWPDLPWHSNDAAANRKLAEQLFYRNYSYRDMSKKGGHGSNYYGKPTALAKEMKVPKNLVEEFQERYFGRFPCIPRMHEWVARTLQEEGALTDLFGRERDFFGRVETEEVLRKAIAYIFQGSTANRTNLGLWRVWYEQREVQLLAQGHDSIAYQVPVTADLPAIIAKSLELCEVWLEHRGRWFTVPGDVKVGFNCGKYDAKLNPNGLKKWKGKLDRERVAQLDLPIT